MLLNLHVTGTREQPVWQLYWTTWSGRHWTLETRRSNQRITMFYRMNTTWCLLLQLTILPQFSHHEAKDQLTTRLFFFPLASVHMWNALPALVIQSGTLAFFKAGISDYYGHWTTSCDHRAAVRDTGLHFTGRWRYIIQVEYSWRSSSGYSESGELWNPGVDALLAVLTSPRCLYRPCKP